VVGGGVLVGLDEVYSDPEMRYVFVMSGAGGFKCVMWGCRLCCGEWYFIASNYCGCLNII